MMLIPNERVKAKVLSKVRRRFLTKTPEENERKAVVDPATHYISNIDGFPIKVSFAVVEIDRKICIGPEYLSFYFNIESTVIKDQQEIMAVTLNLCPNENKPLVPWEYTVQRLESFGDLDLAVWAYSVKNHFENYTQARARIHDLLNSSNSEIQRQLRKIRMRAALTRKEIESKYPYNLYTMFLKRDSDLPLSCCYSKTFLKALGYTPESFIEWSKKNGIPRLFDTNSDIYETIVKGLLKQTPMYSEPIREGSESERIIYNKEGSKMKVRIRFVDILDPTPEGIFHYIYYILCDETSGRKEQLELECEDAIDDGVHKKKAIYEGVQNDDHGLP